MVSGILALSDDFAELRNLKGLQLVVKVLGIRPPCHRWLAGHGQGELQHSKQEYGIDGENGKLGALRRPRRFPPRVSSEGRQLHTRQAFRPSLGTMHSVAWSAGCDVLLLSVA